MARKFLYIVATLIVLAIAALLIFRVYGTELMRVAMVPRTEFKALPEAPGSAYADKARWIARPDMPENPAMWLPKNAVAAKDPGAAAVFYIHPTSYITVGTGANWNAALDDKETNDRAAIFVRGQASVFSGAGEIWAPRYRQANFGAFLTDKPDGPRAIDAAYHDIAAAFDQFVKEVDPKRPIILAGHSQGALHLTRLLHEKIAGAGIQKRIVAAYVVGWPVSAVTDLPAFRMPACTAPDETGCVLSWESFGEPADTSLITAAYDATIGFNGQPRKDTPMVCTNPLTGTDRGAAEPAANRGTLKNAADFSDGELIPGGVGARCDERGFLLIGEGPDLGPYLLPGNNYHVYDFSLFWANIRADAMTRLAAFTAT